jgi:uncharacterized protein (TIGR03083 family)
VTLGPAVRVDPDRRLAVEDYLRVLRTEGARVAGAARSGDLDAPVPCCPGWVLRDVVAHLGWVYRWVTLTVREQRRRAPGHALREALTDPDPTDGSGLIERFVRAHAELVDALVVAPPDLACWTPWPARDGRAFWLRRQVHETLIHRTDVDNALAASLRDGTDLDPRLAADGVDELVRGFIHRVAHRLRHPTPRTLGLYATDTGDQWWARIGPGPPRFGLGPTSRPADTMVAARAGQLFLLLWNRRDSDGLDVRGDHDTLAAWRHGANR